MNVIELDARPDVVVSAKCPRGHTLEPRTTAFRIQAVEAPRSRRSRSRRQAATSYECVPCLRSDCYSAHTGKPTPAELLHPAQFVRQNGWNSQARWWTRVQFLSGHQFADDDPDDKPDKPDKPEKPQPRKNDMSHSDPTSSAALFGINMQRQASPNRATWRDYLDPFELPTESDRADVEALGLEAWRESRAYARYRRHRHGAAA